MELLSGWKEIAEHLHLTVRTAQRWERLGLPVRRVSDSACSPVVAIPDELELWARTREVKATVNEEIQHRNQELAQLSNDLINLLHSATIPIIMLGPDLHIRRYTPEAERIFGFSNHDMGKVFTHLPLNLEVAQLERWMLDVMRDVTMRNEQVLAQDGKSYKLRITPYRTLENKIDGVVVVLLDISDVIAAPASKAHRRVEEIA